MAEIINLRQARKRKAREEKANQAASNRVKFGVTKSERRRQEAQEVLDANALDKAVRQPADPNNAD